MGAALLNHLWQSTAFAVAAALLAWALRRHQARVRFWIWMTASLKFLIPFSAITAAGKLLGATLWPRIGAGLATGLAGAMEARVATVAAPFQPVAPHLLLLPTEVAAPPAPAASLPWAVWLLGLALLGSLVLFARWYWRWRRLARLTRSGRQRDFGELRAVVTTAAVEPGVFGIWRPVLLLPQGLETRLSPAQLEAVLAHERCHLRRRDNLWSALHMLVEALFWFHPLVWWIGGRLVAEREHACDEAVVGTGADREIYAGGLLAVCRYYVESPLRCAAGVGGGKLSQRLRAILDGVHGRGLSRAQMLMLAGCGALALLGPLAAGMMAAPPAAMLSTRLTVATPDSSVDAGTMLDEVRTADIKRDSVRLRVAPPSMNGTDLAQRGHLEQEITVNGGNVTVRNVPLTDLIQLAYGLQPYQIEGPLWLQKERLDLGSVQLREQNAGTLQKLRALLKLRFALEAHPEVRIMRVFELRVAPGGPKFAPAPAGKDFFYASVSPQGEVLSGKATMDKLAAALSVETGSPLLNGTALRGNFNLELHFTRRLLPDEEELGVAGEGFGGGPQFAAKVAAGMSVPDRRALGEEQFAPTFDNPVEIKLLAAALQQQLGLSLEPDRKPVKVMIIDHVNKEPRP